MQVAIAGAPVTDWLVYDTGYTERYLGVPPRTLEVGQLCALARAVTSPSSPGLHQELCADLRSQVPNTVSSCCYIVQ